MEKLLKKRKRLASNSKKGFTLVELIVVIVILAILIAALTPAILGVINRANRTADEADIRTMMTAGSVVGMSKNPPGVPAPIGSGFDEVTVPDQFLAEFSGGVAIQDAHYTIYFDGPAAVGGVMHVGGTARPGIGPRSGEYVGVGAWPDPEDAATHADFDIANPRYKSISILVNRSNDKIFDPGDPFEFEP